MTDEELKKKIVEIIQSVDFYDGLLYRYCIDIATADKLADALTAAGFGDVTEWKEQVECAKRILQILTLPNGTTDLSYFEYKGERIQDIARQRDEYKHRAEVAENELKLYKLAVKIWQERYSDIRCFNFNIALRQAEMELAEGKKDE